MKPSGAGWLHHQDSTLKLLRESRLVGSNIPGRCPRSGKLGLEKAEQWLRKHTNDKSKGNAGRGKEPVFRKQTLSRPQVGPLAYRGSVTLQRLRKREGQESRLQILIEAGKGKEAEARSLRAKVERQGKLIQKEKEQLAKWAAEAERRRKQAWKSWADELIARGGGKLYRWAQRREAGEQLAGLEAAYDESDKPIACRLEAARKAWASLWEGGKAWSRYGLVDVPPIQGEEVRSVLNN